jgi:hypothetical protein
MKGREYAASLRLLTTALCRAVRIPARYVTGYAYANDGDKPFFAPHAWVEVYTDEAGWRTMDPTYGQFAFADAAHIGFCDEPFTTVTIQAGGGIIRILDYSPQEARAIAPPPLATGKLKMPGEELRYEILYQNRKAGEYTAHLQTKADGGFSLLESIEVSIFGANFVTQSELLMDAGGYVLVYSEAGIWESSEREREFSFGGVIKYIGRHGAQKVEKEIPRVFQDEVQVDLYKLAQWGLLAFRLAVGVEEKTVKTVTVFGADKQRYTNITATIRPCPVECGGSMVDGWLCAMSGGQYEQVLYLTGDGVLTRVEIPGLRIRAVLVE